MQTKETLVSGNQFLECWKHKIQTENGVKVLGGLKEPSVSVLYL